MLHFEAPQEPSAVAELSVFYIRFFIGSSIEQIGDQSRNACEQWLESRGARTKVQFLPSIRQVLPCGEVSGIGYATLNSVALRGVSYPF